jgi:hypothetical protein
MARLPAAPGVVASSSGRDDIVWRGVVCRPDACFSMGFKLLRLLPVLPLMWGLPSGEGQGPLAIIFALAGELLLYLWTFWFSVDLLAVAFTLSGSAQATET